MTYSIQQEKRVTVQSYQPTAQSLLTLLEEHAMSTDTQLLEWTVEIEKKANEPLANMMNFQQNRYRWEITLTRSIK